MSKKKKNKKGSKKISIEIILLATAIIQLTAAIITLISVLVNLS